MFLGVGIGVIGMNIVLRTVFGGGRTNSQEPIEYSSN
jgi:hypothetical protein